MEALWAIKSRRSTRRYLDKPVEFDKITAMVEAAHYAPSAGNLQDWRFVVVTDAGLRKKISEHCMEQYWMATAPVLIVVCSHQSAAESRFGLRGARLYTIQDCAAATQNMIIAAQALGLSTCWVGAFDEEYLTDCLGIHNGVRPQAIITLGYSDEKHPPRQLASMDSIYYFNQYFARIDKPHLVLRDYSSEWEEQARKIQPKVDKASTGIKGVLQDGVKSLKDQLDQVRNQPPKKEND